MLIYAVIPWSVWSVLGHWNKQVTWKAEFFFWKALACLPPFGDFFIACPCWVMNSYSWLTFYYFCSTILLFFYLRIPSILLLRTVFQAFYSQVLQNFLGVLGIVRVQGPFLGDHSVPWFWWNYSCSSPSPWEILVFVFMQTALTFLQNYTPVITFVSVFPISYPPDTRFHLLKMSFTFPPLYLC